MPPDPRTKHVAVVEIGTNSAKLLIARVGLSQRFESVYFLKKTTRIGGGLAASHHIQKEAIDRTLHAISTFERKIDAFRCEHVFAFSTYALRRAANAAAVLKRLETRLGCQIKLVSGEQEAHFAFLSARRALALKKSYTLLLDIGGGSTELVLARRGDIAKARSLALGALHLTERFIHSDPIERLEFDRLMRHMDRMVPRALAAIGIDKLTPSRFDLVASGGSVTTAANMIAGSGRSARRGAFASTLRSKDVARLLDRCLTMTLRERKRMPGLEPDRADIIPAGLALTLSFMRCSRKRVLYPNPGGVREGVLVHILANELEW